MGRSAAAVAIFLIIVLAMLFLVLAVFVFVVLLIALLVGLAVAVVAGGRGRLAIGVQVAAIVAVVVAEALIAVLGRAAGGIWAAALGAEVTERGSGAITVGSEGGTATVGVEGRAAILGGEAARVGAAEVGAGRGERMTAVRADLRGGEGRAESSGRRTETAVAIVHFGTTLLAAITGRWRAGGASAAVGVAEMRRRAAGLGSAARVFGAGVGAMLVGGAGRALVAVTFADAVAFTSAGRGRGVVVAGSAWAVVLREGGGGETGDTEEQEQTERRGFHGRGRVSCVRSDWRGLPGRRARAGFRRFGPAGHGGVAFGWQSCSGITITVQRGSVNPVFGKAGELLRAC